MEDSGLKDCRGLRSACDLNGRRLHGRLDVDFSIQLIGISNGDQRLFRRSDLTT
jgi:hypothetical protein